MCYNSFDFMEDLESLLAQLDKLGARGMKFGTEVTRRLLDGLGSPDKKLKIIHIAGTNGKGSVAEYVTRILTSAGKRVGTFTSPAVYDYFGQFRIDGEPIGKELFVKAFGEALENCGGATRFEVETAGAIYAFYLAGCEYAVLECGMGGKNDATNAVAQKELAAVVSVGLEHTAYLGDTLEKIAEQKAGIVKDCPLVVGGYQREAVQKYFKKIGAVFAEPVEFLGGRRFKYAGKEYETGMNGNVQALDAAVAIEIAKKLKISETAIYMGVNCARLPARLEKIEAFGNTYILDGAHNPAAFSALADFLEKDMGGVDFLILGSLSDKDIEQNVFLIRGLAENIIAVRPDSPRAMEPEKIKAACLKYGLNCTVDTMRNALGRARGKIAVCGSFTLYREAKEWIEKRQ